MGKTILLGTKVILFTTVTLAWDCSNREEQLTHTWCDHGCCFKKDPVRCCTWAESMGSVFWTLMGLGSGMFVLSIIVGIVCCCRKKKALEGHVISTGQETSNQARVPLENANQIPTAPNIDSRQTIQSDETIWTISEGTPSANATSATRTNEQNFTNNTDNSIGQQSTTSRVGTRRDSEQPPSYESLPPSYSSLFKNNS